MVRAGMPLHQDDGLALSYSAKSNVTVGGRGGIA